MIRLVLWWRVMRGEQKVAAPANLWTLGLLPSLAPYVDGVQIPPPSLTQSGTDATGDGYGIVQRRVYDGTFWGNEAGLRAFIAEAKAHGLDVMWDFVAHHLAEQGKLPSYWFRGETRAIKDEYGKVIGWHDPIPPYSPQDDVAGVDPVWGMREFSYQHSKGEVLADTIAWLDSIVESFGVTRFRWDDAKGMMPYAVGAVMRTMNGLHTLDFTAEFWSSTPEALAWAHSGPIGGHCKVYDLDWHYALQAACNGCDATQLSGRGGWRYAPSDVHLVVDNPDTDFGQQIVSNKLPAYAITLCLPAHAVDIFGKDWFPDTAHTPGGYGLSHAGLHTVCWFARMFAIGKQQDRWNDRDVYAFTRDGDGGQYGWSGGCLVVVNLNPHADRWVTLHTMWPEGKRIHNYFNGGDVTVGRDGAVSLWLPPNHNMAGQSIGLWAPEGVK